MEHSSRRAALSFGLGLTTILSVFTRARGDDGAPVKPADAPEQSPVVRIGTLDLAAVLKGYEKVKTLAAEFKESALVRQRALQKIASRAEREAQSLQALVPATPEYEAIEAKIAKLKAEFEAESAKAQTEFSQKESEMMADVYKDIKDVAATVARQRKLTFVLKIAADLTSSNPKDVVAALERTVVYSAPEADITNEVIALLNRGR